MFYTTFSETLEILKNMSESLSNINVPSIWVYLCPSNLHQDINLLADHLNQVIFALEHLTLQECIISEQNLREYVQTLQTLPPLLTAAQLSLDTVTDAIKLKKLANAELN